MSQPAWTRTEQIGLSFDGGASPTVALRGQTDGQADLLPTRWGIGWYADNQRAANVVRDGDLPAGTPLAHFLDEWGDVRSNLMVGFTNGIPSDDPGDDIQPFRKSYAGRNWMLAVVGELSRDLGQRLPLDDEAFDIVPVGSSPAEHAFSWILAELRSAGARTIHEYGWRRLAGLFARINESGPASFLLTDGVDLAAFRDAFERVPMYWTRRVPPHETSALHGRAFLIDHDGPLDGARTLLAFSTLPTRGEQWMPLEPGELRVVRRAQSVWSSHPAGIEEQHFALIGEPFAPRRAERTSYDAASQQQMSIASDVPSDLVPNVPTPTGLVTGAPPPVVAPEQATLSVFHETRFTYASPVERSSHRFCLRPIGDDTQEVLQHSLEVSVDGKTRDYQDVFGNLTRLLEVAHPFTEMVISSRSTVRVRGVLASQLKTDLRRNEIPLVWMPWQRQMMQGYLMPPELPEPELRELSEFAMSFVDRNDYDLVETLLDMNRTIYRDFTYVPGATTVETTPFQVYASRRGVCQDFANVLICIARLLGVPARYRVGYIYTGGSYENKIQSDASHAWAEVYLPYTGWTGLDPTNGCLASADHVKVACGRNFRDAAPTTGTIYRGGGNEMLSVDVRVDRLEGEEVPTFG